VNSVVTCDEKDAFHMSFNSLGCIDWKPVSGICTLIELIFRSVLIALHF